MEGVDGSKRGGGVVATNRDQLNGRACSSFDEQLMSILQRLFLVYELSRFFRFSIFRFSRKLNYWRMEAVGNFYAGIFERGYLIIRFPKPRYEDGNCTSLNKSILGRNVIKS